MHCKAVLVTLALSFIVPAFAATVEAAEPNRGWARSAEASCKGKREKKQDGESKPKKKAKDGKKAYGFEL